jgi:hypothetical protein
MKNIYAICMLLGISACGSPVDPDPKSLGSDIAELNSYRNSASARCSGSSYKVALGNNGSATLTGAANISEKLLSKGYGTGSLDIGVTLQEKTEFASLLGNLTNEQVERFLSNYQGCMDKEMTAFYTVKGLKYPEKPTTNSVIWKSQVLKASNTVVAHRTEKSGNWRSYEACVSIPDNGLMLKDSVSTSVISGVRPGTWGNWRNDLKFVDSNAYGPTKVCRGFDHQIHDQDRILEISVNYKLPK